MVKINTRQPQKAVNVGPTSVSLSSTSVMENAAGAVIGSLSAVDPDKGDRVTFEVIGSTSPFEAVLQKGSWVLKLKPDVSLDYEAYAAGIATVQVKATDSGGLERIETFAVQVGDVGPSFTTPSGVIGQVDEGTAALSVSVAASSATGGTVRYTLVDERGEPVSGGPFTVDANGTVTVADATKIDFETARSHTLFVKATDAQGESAVRALTINVADVDEAPTAVTLRNPLAEVPENGAAVKIGDIAVADDALGTETLTLTGADAGAFEIRGTALWFKGGANFEVKSSYSVAVRATDDAGKGSVLSQVFTLRITDVNEAPVLQAGTPSGELTEASAASPGTATSVVKLLATDPDGAAPPYDLTGWLAQGDGTYRKDGLYGWASLDTTANTLTYHLDDARPATEALAATDHKVESFTVAVNDGGSPALSASTTVEFVVHGADDAKDRTLVKLSTPVDGAPAPARIWGYVVPGSNKVLVESTGRLTLDDADTGGQDLFLWDPATQTHTLLTGTDPGQPEGTSYLQGGITPGGRFAVVSSTAALSPEDKDGGSSDLYAIDLATKTRTLLTASITDGAEGDSYALAYTPDGKTAIVKSMSTLTGDDTDLGGFDLFAVDLATGAKTLLTRSVPGTSEASADMVWIAPDGRTVVIQTASTLTADDTPLGENDLFAYDLETNQTTLISGSLDGASEGRASVVRFTPDGGTLILESTSTLTEGDGEGGGADLFAYDLSSGTKTLLTASAPGGAEGYSSLAALTPDGRMAIVQSTSTLTGTDTDAGGADLFAVDVASGARTLLTASLPGAFEGLSTFSRMTADGRTVLFESSSTLTQGDADDGGVDVFAYDLETGATRLLTPSLPGGTEGDSLVRGLSPDGRVAIVESASRLTEDDTDEGGMDFFAVDLAGGATRLLTASATGQADGSSYFAGFTPGGAAILQSNIALTAEDEDGYDWDVYSVDVANGAKTLLTATVPGGAEGFSQAMRFTEDGRILFVGSRAALTADDQDASAQVEGAQVEGGYDLYAIDLTTGDKTLLDSDPDAAISPVGFSLGTYPYGPAALIGVAGRATAEDGSTVYHQDLYWWG